MPPITVTVLAGPAAGATCTKDAKQKICLGRIKTGNLIPLKDNQVSGKHVEISWDNGCWFALDLDSTNGTRINDSANRCLTGQKYKLRSGDQLHLGPDTTVQVHFDVSTGLRYSWITNMHSAILAMCLLPWCMFIHHRLAAALDSRQAPPSHQTQQQHVVVLSS